MVSASVAHAQAVTADRIATEIGLATQQVLIYSPWLKNKNVADAIRVAVAERGIRVYLLSPQESIWDKASYFGSLALAGARLYTGTIDKGLISNPFLVIDNNRAIIGRQIGLNPNIYDPMLTRLTTNPAEVKRLVTWYAAALTKTKPIDMNAVVARMILDQRK